MIFTIFITYQINHILMSLIIKKSIFQNESLIPVGSYTSSNLKILSHEKEIFNFLHISNLYVYSCFSLLQKSFYHEVIINGIHRIVCKKKIKKAYILIHVHVHIF